MSWVRAIENILGIKRGVERANFRCSSELFLEMASKVPSHVKRRRHGSAPSFQDFVEVVRRYPSLVVEGYITPSLEDIKIIGARGSRKAVEELVKRASKKPDILEEREGLLRALWS